VILRLLRASLAPEDAPRVVAALRADHDRAREWPGLVSWTHGIRREGDIVRGIAMSVWADYDALLRVARGRPDRDISDVSRTNALHDVTTEHYELSESTSDADVTLDAEVLGVITGTIRPHVEGTVHDMIRAIRPSLVPAGVAGLLVGRRVVEQRTEIVVVAPWRDRLSLHEFARSRAVGAIDPAFAAHLDPWRFETFECLSSDRPGAEPWGAAVLVVDDDRRCVDVSPGVEGILGCPGELLLGHTLDDLVEGPTRASLRRSWPSTEPAGGGEFRLRLAVLRDTVVELRATVVRDAPRPGLHSLTLTGPPAPARHTSRPSRVMKR
jgi:PAS domain-containing protein